MTNEQRKFMNRLIMENKELRTKNKKLKERVNELSWANSNAEEWRRDNDPSYHEMGR